MNIYVSLKGNKVITPTNKDQIIEGNILCLTTLWVLRRRAVNTLRNGIMTSMVSSVTASPVRQILSPSIFVSIYSRVDIQS